MNIWKMIFKREHGAHQMYIFFPFFPSFCSLPVTFSLPCSTLFGCHHSFFFWTSSTEITVCLAIPSLFVLLLHHVKLMYYTLMYVYLKVWVFVCLKNSLLFARRIIFDKLYNGKPNVDTYREMKRGGFEQMPLIAIDQTIAKSSETADKVIKVNCPNIEKRTSCDTYLYSHTS